MLAASDLSIGEKSMLFPALNRERFQQVALQFAAASSKINDTWEWTTEVNYLQLEERGISKVCVITMMER